MGGYQLMDCNKKGLPWGYLPKQSLLRVSKMPVNHPPIQGKDPSTEFTGLDTGKLFPIDLHTAVDSVNVCQQRCLRTLWDDCRPMLWLPVVG